MEEYEKEILRLTDTETLKAAWQEVRNM